MVKNLIILGLSTCFTLLICELGLRYRLKAWPFERAFYFPEYLKERDTTLRWRFSPFQGGRNSLGLRNRELGPKPTDTQRILFLGDSLIWTGDTSSGDLYTVVLERRLNQRFPNNPNTIEIINAGIPGYTTYQELEFLKIYGLDMQPDLVILGFVFNDLYYRYAHRPTDRQVLDLEPTTYLYAFDPSAFPGYLFGRSYLAHEVVIRGQVLWKTILGRPVFSFEQRRDFYLAWKNYGWNDVGKLIRELQNLLRERGIPLIILVFPVSEQVDDNYRQLNERYVLYPQAKIGQICDTAGIPMLDLTQSIYTSGGKTLFRDYVHLNAAGNDIITNELEKYLVDRLGRDGKFKVPISPSITLPAKNTWLITGRGYL